MAEAGADVVVHYRQAEDKAAEVVRQVQGMGRRAIALKADVRHADQVTRLVRLAAVQFGRLDILVNNAGYALSRSLDQTTPNEWDDQMATLPRGYFLAAQAAAPYLAESGRGTIVNVASVSGVRGEAGFTAYSAANGGIMALTKALAAELGPRGVRVNAVLVSWATTEDNPIDPGNPAHEEFLRQVSLGRATAPEEIARAAVFLASDAASAMNGALVPVDAGYL